MAGGAGGPAGKSRAFIENSLKQDAGLVEGGRLAGVQPVDQGINFLEIVLTDRAPSP
jgi:hypothetical protein